MPRGLGVRVPPPARNVVKAEESGGGREVYPNESRGVPPPARNVVKAEESGGGREVYPNESRGVPPPAQNVAKAEEFGGLVLAEGKGYWQKIHHLRQVITMKPYEVRQIIEDLHRSSL